jgi:hypothetical protein
VNGVGHAPVKQGECQNRIADKLNNFSELKLMGGWRDNTKMSYFVVECTYLQIGSDNTRRLVHGRIQVLKDGEK